MTIDRLDVFEDQLSFPLRFRLLYHLLSSHVLSEEHERACAFFLHHKKHGY